MLDRLPETLALINDVLQAAIVVFGAAVALYYLGDSIRDRVTRAFVSLLFFVVLVYFTELLVTRTTIAFSTEIWVRLEWIGIAMVPAALFHLADALLVATGAQSRRRRLFVRVWYLSAVLFFLLAIFTDLIVSELVLIPRAPHLNAGPLFPLFVVYFWLVSGTSVYLVWRARQRCVTHTTRKRMTMILVAFLAAPLAVFPYLILSNDPAMEVSTFFWLILIMGNLTIGTMFALLTYYIAYFGATSPDRVVRVRLFKFMARVPLAATIVLLVYVAVNRASSVLGLHEETALAIAVVGTIILVEWAIHAFKRPLERLFQLTDEPEVRRIQQLSERVLTTRDMRQFLESIVAASCEVLRTPSAFVAAFTPEGPRLEAMVSPSPASKSIWAEEEWRALAKTASGHSKNGEDLETSGQFLVWRDFWILPLHNNRDDALVGIFGVKARSQQPDLNEEETIAFEQLADQASRALEDRILQQEVFASVEGLLPQVSALQRRRIAATFGGAPVLTAPMPDDVTVIDDPEFYNMVWDALSHYWGGPKLTESPLMHLQVVQRTIGEQGESPTRALRSILARAVEQQRPKGERSMTTAEWILYNILELKFIQGKRVRDVARRLAMSESDLYRKQRIAIENVAQTILQMEEAALSNPELHYAVGSHDSDTQLT